MAKSMSILIAQLAYGFLHFIFIFLQKSHWPNEFIVVTNYNSIQQRLFHQLAIFFILRAQY